MKIAHLILASLILLYTLFNVSHLSTGEWTTLTIIITTLLAARFIWKRDLTGYFFAAIIFGVVIEYITEAYWIYDARFVKDMYPNFKGMKVFLFPNSIFHDRDLSFFIIIGWGFHLTFLTLISNWVFRKVTGQTSDAIQFAPSILACDGLVGIVWLTLNEILGMKLNLWFYDKDISKWVPSVPIPLLGISLPWESILGAGLLALITPTFLRHWQPYLRFSRTKNQ
jgi:hypothetical protein